MVRQSAFRLALLLAIGGSVLTGCGGSEPPGPESVVLIDIGSGDRRALVEGASGPAWSADGARIAFVSRGPMPSIELIRPDGTGRRPLKTVAGSSVVGLSWAPGGGRIAACVAAIEAPGSPMRLWILDPAGGGQRKIFEAAGGRAACDPPAWSPDGGRIAFVGPPGRDLRVIDPDGGRAPAIAPSDDDGSEPLWPEAAGLSW